MTERLTVSRDDMTIGDLEDFEEITQIPFDEFFDNAQSSEGTEQRIPLKVLKALVFITKRKAEPDLTIDDVRKVTVGELQLLLGSSRPPRAVRRSTAKKVPAKKKSVKRS